MNILLICGSLPPIKCGVGDYTDKLCENLSELGCNITVLTSLDASKTKHYEVENTVRRWKGVSLINQVSEFISNGCYDVVHIQMPAVNYVRSVANYIILPIILKLKGCKVVYTLHEYSDCREITKFCRFASLLLFSDEIIVADPIYKSEITKRFGRRIGNKVSFINIGSSRKII